MQSWSWRRQAGAAGVGEIAQVRRLADHGQAGLDCGLVNLAMPCIGQYAQLRRLGQCDWDGWLDSKPDTQVMLRPSWHGGYAHPRRPGHRDCEGLDPSPNTLVMPPSTWCGVGRRVRAAAVPQPSRPGLPLCETAQTETACQPAQHAPLDPLSHSLHVPDWAGKLSLPQQC